MSAVNPVTNFERLSKWWVVLVIAAVTVAVSMLVFSEDSPFGQVRVISEDLPEMSPLGSGEDTQTFLKTLGDDGRKAYGKFLWIDFGFGFLNFLLLTALAAFVLRFATKTGSGVRHLLWFGPIGYIADVVENVLLMQANKGFDLANQSTGELAVNVTTGKFVCLGILILTFAIALFAAIRQKILNRSKKVGGNTWNN